MRARRRFKTIVTVCALVAGLSVGAPAKILYVDDDAPESGDGSSWASACRYLQTALAAAATGDEIHVAQGLYRPDLGLPPFIVRDRGSGGMAETSAVGWPGAAFDLKSGVALLGGFAGPGAVDPNARDLQKYPTILSGDLRGNDGDLLDLDLWGPERPLLEYLRTDNSIFVVQCIWTDASAVLDGFAVGPGTYASISNVGGSPRVVNCVFPKGYGTDLRCAGGQPTLVNCLFQENSGWYGAAIEVTNARVTLTDCRFLGNRAGAIYAVGSDLTLTGCTFERNAAQSGGAIRQTTGTLTLVDCTFEGNAANQEGGAVSFAGEKASMTRCVFRKNWVIPGTRSYTFGGAVVDRGASLMLDRCTFTSSMAGMGGALYASPPARSNAPAGRIVTVTHCLFAGNYASSKGGAFYSDRTDLTIRNVTFIGNQAEAGATIGWDDKAGESVCSVTLENSIVRDGRESISSSRPAPATRSRALEAVATVMNVTVRYSDVQGGWAGEGNIDVDPYFAAPGYWADAYDPARPATPDYSKALWIDGDYHLKSQAGRWDPTGQSWVLDEVTSPCIDAGDPNSPVGDEPQPNGGRINMGAYGGTVEASMSRRSTWNGTSIGTEQNL